MKRFSLCFLCLSILTLSLIGCGETPSLPEKAGIGPDPVLPKPEPSLLSMVNIAPAEGFAEGGALWEVPDYALGAHTAGLGLTFYTADLFPAEYHGGAFVSQHGSWNRKPHNGHKVIFVPFEAGRPAGESRDILIGFLSEDGKALGRPAGVTINNEDALLVADDVANTIGRVTPASALVRL